MEKQRSHRNNEIRTDRIVVGELTAKDDAPVEGSTYTVCTIPAGVILTSIYAQSVGAGDVDVTLEGGNIFTVDVTPTETQGVINNTIAGLVTTEPTPVDLTVNAAIPFGRVLVGIEYVDLDTVTGDRVDALES